MPKMSVYNKNKKFGFVEEVIVKKHVIDRVRERRVELKNKTDFEIKRIVTHEIQNSRLISIAGKEEHRNYFGKVYICKREQGKLVAVTYVLSKDEMKKIQFKKAM